MLTALEFYGVIPENMPKRVEEMIEWLRRLPDCTGKEDGSHLWSCHALARAAKLKWQLDRWRVADGFFRRVGTNHSWLVRDGDRQYPKLILDVYPVRGFRVPLLIDANEWGSTSPWDDLYREQPDFYSEKHRAQWERDAAAVLTASH